MLRSFAPLNPIVTSIAAFIFLNLLSGFAVSEVNIVKQESEPEPIRVMSFNIRYGTANDGVNHWDKRREFLIDTIRKYDPDLLGTQETLGFQKDFIAAELNGYQAIGVGRDHGGDEGEMTAIFFRTSRFEKVFEGHFWLSETPAVPGSKSWDTSLTRMASYVILKDLQDPEHSQLLFLNTHFDHRGQLARLRSAELLVKKASELAPNLPAIITGDFNTAENSAPYVALFGKPPQSTTSQSSGDTQQPQAASYWRDTFRIIHREPASEEGTFSGFSIKNTQGPRIDWIACTPHWKVLKADIDRTEREGRTPSDHFPVTAELILEKQAKSQQ
jgi:endonuclease/exonuclease/phosphatase family metal-dependent hydrolase